MKERNPHEHQVVFPAAAIADMPRLTDHPGVDVTDPDTGVTTHFAFADGGHPGKARATIASLITAFGLVDEAYRDREIACQYGVVAR